MQAKAKEQLQPNSKKLSAMPLPQIPQRKPKPETAKNAKKMMMNNITNPSYANKPGTPANPQVLGAKQEEGGYTLEKLLSIVDMNLLHADTLANANITAAATATTTTNATTTATTAAINNAILSHLPQSLLPQPSMFPLQEKPAANHPITIPSFPDSYLDLEQKKIKDAEETLATKAKELGKDFSYLNITK